MGYAISWLAVRGSTTDSRVRELGLVPTGDMGEPGESMFTGRTLSNGWSLLVIDQCDHELIRQDALTRLSRDCEVVACSVEEHVMSCTAELWKNGQQVWRIEHDAQESIDHINTSGLLPDVYAQIRKEYTAQQSTAGGKNSDTDYFFEIPLQTAKALVGFKHDEAELEDDSFEIYRADSTKRNKPWWKAW